MRQPEVHRLRCPRCARSTLEGDRFCGFCSTPLDADVPAPRQPLEGHRLLDHPLLDEPEDRGHETTRVLCAAVHRDPDLAAALIDEFLTEPKRCIPWSRGVDNAAVLTDAIAAFRRCQVRDVFLLLFAVLVAFTIPLLALGWLTVALIAAGWGVGDSDGLPAAAEHRRRSTTVLGCVAGVLLAALVLLPTLGVAVAGLSGNSSSAESTPQLGIGSPDGGYVAVLTVVGVLTLDVLGTTHLLVTAFGRTVFVPDPRSHDTSPWRRLGSWTFRLGLGRVRVAEALQHDCADVVVFRDDSPFCGAGEPGTTRAFALTLYHADTDEEVSPTGLDRELHQSIREAMDELRRSPSLSPNHRLRALRRREQLLVPAEELVRHAGDPELARLLPRGLGGAPLAQIDLAEAQRGIEHPHEWARYYQHFSLEAWDRDLVVSWYVTLATDRQYLYLQWTPCVLLPVPPGIRDGLDDIRALWNDARSDVVTRVLTFPATLLTRLRRATRRFRAMRVPGDVAVPAQFGAADSVREMAVDHLARAANSVPPYMGQWFQRSDARRYAILVDRVLIEAVRRCLVDQHLSLKEFDQVAQTIVNNFSGISGSTIAVGDGATAVAGVAPGPLAPGGAS